MKPSVFAVTAMMLAASALGQGALPPGHPPAAPGKAAPSSEQLIEQLDASGGLKTKEKTFEVAAALGKLYYAHGRYEDASEYLGQAVLKAEGTRGLYLQQRKKAEVGKKPIPTAAEAGCLPTPETTLEGLTALGRAKAKLGDPGAAAACAP